MLLNNLLSIIIPHLKGQAILNECLISIYDNIKNMSCEVLVIDNNSLDNSTNFINHKFPDTKVIRSDANLGYAGGCNLGAQYAKGDYLLFLNNDTIITKKFY